MYIKSFRVLNYKSFADTGDQILTPGFNIILGKNNAGKTALLEAISLLPFGDKPHRDASMRRNQPVKPKSEVHLEIVLSPQDLTDAALAAGKFIIPVDAHSRADKGVSFLTRFLSKELAIKLRYNHQSSWIAKSYPSHELFKYDQTPPPQKLAIEVRRNPDMNGVVAGQFLHSDSDQLPDVIGKYVQQSVYIFRAERLGLSTHAFGPSAKLRTDAQNLAEVLNVLQGHHHRFDEYNRLVNLIFPNVRRISVRPYPTQAGQLEILVWNTIAPPDRDDLAQPLSESGTGIGQILAMLYILVTSENPQAIVIDEPNTFLHPGAIRKLIKLMKGAPVNHQYIITTHSADIISMAEAETIHMVSWENEKSKVETLKPSNMSDLRRALHEVDARLSDLFGADHLIWVEGPTEQICFPLVRAHFKIQLPIGTEIVPLKHTGDLESRSVRARAIWEIYKQISTAGSLMPSTLAFSLDRELRSEKEIEDMQRQAGAVVRFLPRRTYENYLLNPAAITALLNTLPSFKEQAIDAGTVKQWIAQNGANREFFGNNAALPVTDPKWIIAVNAPKLLIALFQQLSDAKETYNKLTHSVDLTKWLLAHDPKSLSELAVHIHSLIPGD